MRMPRRALLAAALLPLTARANEPPPGATLLCLLEAPPASLVPGTSDSLGTRLVGSNLYRGLTRLDADGTAQPDLATWTMTPDRLRYQFQLQPGLTWHDGTPITAADVVFSLDRVHRHRNPGLGIARFAAITAAGEQTVVIELNTRFDLPRSLNGLAAAIVPQHVHDVVQWGLDPAATTPVGCGPFRYDGWLRLVRIGAGPVGAIVFPIVPRLADRITARQRHPPALLVSDRVDGAALATLRADATLAVEPADPPAARHWALLWLNPQRPPLDQPALRLALAAAVDHDALVWAVWNGFANPPATAAYNPAAAAAQLQAAGLRPGEDGMRAQFRLLLPPGPVPAAIAAALTRMLSLVAVDLAPDPATDEDWQRRMDTADYDLAIDLREQPAPSGDVAIRLAQPLLAVARDRRLQLPDGVFGGLASATLA